MEAAIEKATAQSVAPGAEDWAQIMEVCDRVNHSDSAAGEAVRILLRRAADKHQNVAYQALVVLEACVKNCRRPFHSELFKRDNLGEISRLLQPRYATNIKVCGKINELLRDWESEYGNDPAFSGIRTVCSQLRNEGFALPEKGGSRARATSSPQQQQQQQQAQPPVAPQSRAQEEDDIARAIALSLQDANGAAPKRTPSPAQPQKKRVRALFEFDPKEDNELGFKEGEIINIIDDSDPNWWRGEIGGFTGFFPANFVEPYRGDAPKPQSQPQSQPQATAPRPPAASHAHSQAAPQPQQQQAQPAGAKRADAPAISAEQVDVLLQMLSNADPAGGSQAENDTIAELMEACLAMRTSLREKQKGCEARRESYASLNERFCKAIVHYDSLQRQVRMMQQQQAQQYGGMVAPPAGAGGYPGYSAPLPYPTAGGPPPPQQPGGYYGAPPPQHGMPPPSQYGPPPGGHYGASAQQPPPYQQVAPTGYPSQSGYPPPPQQQQTTPIR
eukprot:Opistho-1_new@27084